MKPLNDRPQFSPDPHPHLGAFAYGSSGALRPFVWRVLGAFALCWLLLSTSLSEEAFAQSVRIAAESDTQAYVDEPFVISVVVEGFEEKPTPSLSPVIIEGARIRYLNMSPNVSRGVSIVNGHRAEWSNVTYSFRYEVTPSKAGRATIEPITATQGTTSALSTATSFEVGAISITKKMKLELVLPKRPLWPGERAEVVVEWLLDPSVLEQFQRRDAFSGRIRQSLPEHIIRVPLFMEEGLNVSAFPGTLTGNRQQTFSFETSRGAVEVPVDFEEQVMLGGKAFGRLRFRFELRPAKTGTFKSDRASVVAELSRPKRRRRRSRSVAGERKKAFAAPVTLEVRPLPKDAPSSFRGALGEGFGLSVSADRTIVKVGEPIELEIILKGAGELKGLRFPLLDRAGLSADLFSVPSTAPIGEHLDTPSGPARRFRIPVRLKSDKVRELPPIEFGYFNPEKGTYQVARSQPIALSVSSAKIVSAKDINNPKNPNAGKGASKEEGSSPAKEAGAFGGVEDFSAGGATRSLVGVELGLSDPEASLDRVSSIQEMTPWLVGLYGLPLFLFGWIRWRGKTASGRELKGEVKEARDRLEKAFTASGTASEVLPAITSALQGLAKSLKVAPDAEDKEHMKRLEMCAFSPSSAASPPKPEDIAAARSLAQKWLKAPRSHAQTKATKATKDAKNSVGASLLILLALGSLLSVASSAEAGELEDARKTYQEALDTKKTERRTATFARAEAMFTQLTKAHPGAPNLLVDRGNAALGAQNLGAAVLSYRRALLLAPGDTRATRNLTWVREHATPKWLAHPEEAGATSAFFFWNGFLSPALCWLLGAVAFAMMVLLLIPKRRTLPRALALAPALLWLWLSAAAFAAPHADGEAVVMQDDTILRTADSEGASAALEERLPAGAEVLLLESRGAWRHVQLHDGKQGWLRSDAIEEI